MQEKLNTSTDGLNGLISVIIPIYNVEPYLKRCLDSIIKNTYTNLEIICVDDGSTDRCGEICREYAERDSRIRVIHKKNGGISSARNAGLDLAIGSYVAFIDSDDWVHERYFELLLKEVQHHKADISVCSYTRKASVAPDYTIENDYSVRVFDRAQAAENHNTKLFAWGKLYTRNVIQDIRFDEKLRTEDVAFNSEVYSASPKCKTVFFDAPLYVYTFRKNSLSESFVTEDFVICSLWYFSLSERESDYKLRQVWTCSGIKHGLFAVFRYENENSFVKAKEVQKRNREHVLRTGIRACYLLPVVYCSWMYRLALMIKSPWVRNNELRKLKKLIFDR